jgi:2-polyprenyl-3-methyl-5-hydroxy-6-metoxy-1,4-benzoquinol methylase
MNVVKDAILRSTVPLEPTSERMVPESADRFTFWEHVYRYAFACRFVGGKRVLDIACGEGYGAAALQRAGAASVIGVDISERVCLHVSERYGIDARVGSAENIPVADESVDAVVSFETIEHVPNPLRFLEECSRVLTPGGRLIISTPNKEVYSSPGRAANPYHCSEMKEREFASALGSKFDAIRLYTQRARTAGWWSLRALAAETTPRIRGYARLRRSAQFRLFPRAVYDPTVEERVSVVEEILAASRTFTHPLHGCAVRPRRRWAAERATYFVAVAVRPS